MDTVEMSNEFDVLLSSFTIDGALVLDEYEKSVCLTQAQKQIVVEIYSGIVNSSFERTEEVKRYLSNLVKTYETSSKESGILGLSKSSIFFKIPEDVWFITYESAVLDDERLECLNKTEAVIVPTTQDEYYRISRNPFRGPTKGRALRLDIKDNMVEIISDYNITKYLVRYLAEPTPIVLVDLGDVSVDGISTKTECKLDKALHKPILDRAVRIALSTKAQYANRDNK